MSARSLLKKVAATFSALSLCTLAACTGSTSTQDTQAADLSNQEITGEISFQTWSLKSDRFSPYFEDLIARFEEQHPGVKIKWLDQPGDGYEDKLLQQANSNDLPDVVNIPPEFGVPLAKAGMLMDLKSADASTLNNYVSGAVKAYEYYGVNGSFAYPWYLGVSFNYWNTDAIAKAGLDPNNLPSNQEEYLAAVKTAAANGVALIYNPVHIAYLAAQGIEIFDESTRQFTFANDEAVALLTEYAELAQEGGMPAELLNFVDDGKIINEAFYSSQLGLMQSTSSFAVNMAKDAPTLVDKVVVSEPWEIPQLHVQGIAVSNKSKNPAAALAFAQFVTNDENQIEFIKIARGFLPGTIKANDEVESLELSTDSELFKEATAVAAQTIKRAELLTPFELSDSMKTAYQQEISLALQGKEEPRVALQKAQDRLNSMLER